MRSPHCPVGFQSTLFCWFHFLKSLCTNVSFSRYLRCIVLDCKFGAWLCTHSASVLTAKFTRTSKDENRFDSAPVLYALFFQARWQNLPKKQKNNSLSGCDVFESVRRQERLGLHPSSQQHLQAGALEFGR